MNSDVLLHDQKESKLKSITKFFPFSCYLLYLYVNTDLALRRREKEWMAGVASSRTLLACYRPADGTGLFWRQIPNLRFFSLARSASFAALNTLAPQLPSLSPLAIFPTNWHKVSIYFALNLQKTLSKFLYVWEWKLWQYFRNKWSFNGVFLPGVWKTINFCCLGGIY